MEIPVYSTSSVQRSNKLTLKGNVAINNATLVVNLSSAANGLTNNVNMQVFTLSDATITGTGFTTIVPERPSETQIWDTTDLLTKGWLRAVEDPEVTRISNPAAEKHDGKAYNLNGQAVDEGTVKGLYIKDGKKYIK